MRIRTMSNECIRVRQNDDHRRNECLTSPK
nr:MAG TPA: hypothetical protein [Caudoviricetes sp.]